MDYLSVVSYQTQSRLPKLRTSGGPRLEHLRLVRQGLRTPSRGARRGSCGSGRRGPTGPVDRCRSCHVGHRDWAFEDLAAPGADAPVEAHQTFAVWANAIESGTTPRTDNPFALDSPITPATGLDRLDFGQEGLFCQVPLVNLAKPFGWPHDLVDNHAENEEERREEDDQAGGQVGQDRVLGPIVHVAESPVRRGEPDDEEIEDDRVED